MSELAITSGKLVAAYGRNSCRIMGEDHAQASENMKKIPENLEESSENDAKIVTEFEQMFPNSIFYLKIAPETSK